MQCLPEFVTQELEIRIQYFLLPDDKNLEAQSWQYISYILQHQASNGWLGVDDITGGNMYWGRWNLLNAFRMYAEGNSTMAQQLKQSMLRFILQQQYRMMHNTSYGNTWSGARWMDFTLSVMWLLENGGDIINGYTQNLTDVIVLGYEQGFNWEDWFAYDLPHQPDQPANLYNHGVNVAQAFKSAAVW